MRRLPLSIASPLGWAAVGGMGVAAALAAMTYFARADSIGPDLSGLQALIASVQATASTAQTQATAAQSFAASSAQAASTAATAAQTAQSAVAQGSDYGGTVTLAQLGAMQPSATTGKRMYVTDLGGGSGPVYSTGTCFKREVPAAMPTIVQASANVTGQALTVSSLIQMTAPSSLLANVNVAVTGLCPGDILTVYMPNGVLTAAGTLGVSLNAASAITVTGVGSAYSADFLWTGTSALKLRGGPVQ